MNPTTRNHQPQSIPAGLPDVYRGRALVQWYFAERGGVVGSPMGKLMRGGEFSQGGSFTSEPACSGRCGGGVARAIASLPPLQQNWVHYCYNPSRRKKSDVRDAFFNGLWKQYASHNLKPGSHTSTRTIVRFLFTLQWHAGRNFHEFNKWVVVRPVEARELITADMWKKTHSRHWRQIRQLMVSMDNESMRQVLDRSSA